jgi:hypothetical protein
MGRINTYSSIGKSDKSRFLFQRLMDTKYAEVKVCRSAVCGGDVFIPDSEYQGEDCELTCDIEDAEQSTRTND